jgi:hypothetical protein
MRRNTKIRLVCLSGALLGVSMSDVFAQEAQRPTPFVGYTMRFEGRMMGMECAEWRLAEIKDNGDIVSTCGEYRLEMSGENDLNPRKIVDGEGNAIIDIKPYAPSIQYPLAIGTRWRKSYVAYTAYNGLVWDGEAECESKAYEEITVPAGTFNAFRIECRDKWQIGPQAGYTHSTRWYAPEVAGVIKSEHREDPARWNFELASYGLPEPNAANTVDHPATPRHQLPPLPGSVRADYPPFLTRANTNI